jgi:hypothetical protein
LQGELDSRVATDAPDLGCLMTDHYDQPVRMETLGSVNDTREQGLSRDPVQYLGLSGTHAFPQTSRKNDNAEMVHCFLSLQ